MQKIVLLVACSTLAVCLGCQPLVPSRAVTNWYPIEVKIAEVRVRLVIPADWETRERINKISIRRDELGLGNKESMAQLPITLAYDQPAAHAGFSIQIGAIYDPNAAISNPEHRLLVREEEFLTQINQLDHGSRRLQHTKTNEFELVTTPSGLVWDRHFHESLTPVVIDRYHMPIQDDVLLLVVASYDKDKWRTSPDWFSKRLATVKTVLDSVSIQ